MKDEDPTWASKESGEQTSDTTANEGGRGKRASGDTRKKPEADEGPVSSGGNDDDDDDDDDEKDDDDADDDGDERRAANAAAATAMPIMMMPAATKIKLMVDVVDEDDDDVYKGTEIKKPAVRKVVRHGC